MATTARAAYFSPTEQEILMEAYEGVKHIIKKKGNTATIVKQRERGWQTIADQLNAINMTGPKRTWQQVKIKHKNILQTAIKKKIYKQDTEGSSPKPDLTPAEDKVFNPIKGRPVLEGIRGGTATDSCPSKDATPFMDVSGNTINLIDPPEPPTPVADPKAPELADPGEGTSATTAAADDDDDEDETPPLDSRKPEDPDAAQTESLPDTMNSHAVRELYTTHLKRQIELADVQIQYKKRKMQDMYLESEIKRQTLRKLDLEIKKLEREDAMDEEALVLRRALRRERVFQDRSDPLVFSDNHLYERYKFSGEGIRYLCRLLGPRIQHRTAWGHALTVPQMVCVALRFFASGSFLYTVGDAEYFTKATICRIVRSVTLALKSIAHIFITFPGHRSLCYIKEEFHRIAGFPNVIGALDCTHIRIKCPSANEEDFVNRKSFHSINVQMVCNADCTISNVDAKWPGSVHDWQVFRASTIYQRLSEGEFSGVLLGDGGYACETFLLTPFKDPEAAQQAYNHAHARTRARIETTFGLLKARFQCLRHLRVSPERACDITVACAVLHNVACFRRERAPRVLPDTDWDNSAIFPDDNNGTVVRNHYVLHNFN